MCRLDRISIAIGFAIVLFAPATTRHGLADELAGVTVRLEDDNSPATIRVTSVARYKVKISLDSQAENKPLDIRVELPISGRDAWPIANVAAFDSKGRPLAVRRGGIAWHRLLITAPPERGAVIVQTVQATDDRPQLPPEKERLATDSNTGLNATICRWRDGRRAALSIRFDDSHPTHLSKAIPILNTYGFRGTFMVNPGGHSPNNRQRSAFEERRAEWEAVAKRGRHEFANHTMHHRGAKNDEQMEREVGDAAKAIWRLFPQKSKLAALNLGGGTQWVTTRTLQYYLDKYHLFDASSNSTGMDDVYGKRVATFRRLLEAHIDRGLWYKIHYHYIGKNLSSSEANFRAVLNIAKKNEAQLWIAGMADIHKYQTERRSARLAIESDGPSRVSLRLSCTTKPELYDQPLTIEVVLPKSWLANRVMVRNREGKAIATQSKQSNGQTLLYFDVAPRNGLYSVGTE